MRSRRGCHLVWPWCTPSACGFCVRRRCDAYRRDRRPGEGIDRAGFIVTGVAVEAIPVVYHPVLESSITHASRWVPDLVAIYLYGSVATGHARPPALGRRPPRDRAESSRPRSRARHCGRSCRHCIETSPETSGSPWSRCTELWADDLDGLGGRCFVKHYCVPLYGDDVRRQLPRCRASPQVAWAFNHDTSVAVADAHAAWSSRIRPRRSARSVASRHARSHCRRRHWPRSWSRPGPPTATAPPSSSPPGIREWAQGAADALRWCSSPTDCRAAVYEFLHGFASWVASELARHKPHATTPTGRTRRSASDDPVAWCSPACSLSAVAPERAHDDVEVDQTSYREKRLAPR